MTERHLVLHIGFPKTATTTLQRSLLRHDDAVSSACTGVYRSAIYERGDRSKRIVLAGSSRASCFGAARSGGRRATPA